MSSKDTADLTALRYDVFAALHEAWVEGKDDPERFVGMQGDNIVVIAKGGHYFAINVVPAIVSVGA